MKEENKKEFQKRIVVAGRKELLLIHFEMILEELKLADQSIKEKKNEDLKVQTQTAQELLKKMVEALDFHYEVSYSLLKLYQKINKDIINGKLHFDRGYIKQARRLLEDLKQIFMAAELQDNTPLVQNSEVLYAGLTYGKDNQLKESVDYKKRGFQA